VSIVPNLPLLQNGKVTLWKKLFIRYCGHTKFEIISLHPFIFLSALQVERGNENPFRRDSNQLYSQAFRPFFIWQHFDASACNLCDTCSAIDQAAGPSDETATFCCHILLFIRSLLLGSCFCADAWFPRANLINWNRR